MSGYHSKNDSHSGEGQHLCALICLTVVLSLCMACGDDDNDEYFHIAKPFPDVTAKANEPVYINLSDHLEGEEGEADIDVIDLILFEILDVEQEEITWDIDDNSNCTVTGPTLVTVDEYRRAMANADMSNDYDVDYTSKVWQHDPNTEIPVIILTPGTDFVGLDRMSIVVEYSRPLELTVSDEQPIKVWWE